jgi:RsiW-degrading membrane proteinase PrsW (M82 family)
METKKEINQLIFYIFFILFCYVLFLFVGSLNSYFDNLLSRYLILIKFLKIPFLSVVIAPITEEIIKFLGYAIIYITGIRLITALDYNSKKEFRNDYLIVAFLISTGCFGFFEGVSHNRGFGLICLVPFVSLNMMAHITYSIYPYILGRRYNNWFILFLPIGMLLHSVHNFVIDNILDNKWVTFTMVTAFLLPIIGMENKNLYKIIERLLFLSFKNSKRSNRIIIGVFAILYLGIFLCVWLSF